MYISRSKRLHADSCLLVVPFVIQNVASKGFHTHRNDVDLELDAFQTQIMSGHCNVSLYSNEQRLEDPIITHGYEFASKCAIRIVVTHQVFKHRRLLFFCFSQLALNG